MFTHYVLSCKKLYIPRVILLNVPPNICLWLVASSRNFMALKCCIKIGIYIKAQMCKFSPMSHAQLPARKRRHNFFPLIWNLNLVQNYGSFKWHGSYENIELGRACNNLKYQVIFGCFAEPLFYSTSFMNFCANTNIKTNGTHPSRGIPAISPKTGSHQHPF